jgi:hypothetical protein
MRIIPTRYIIAIAMAGLITGAAFGLSRYLRNSFLERFHQSLHEAAAAGTFPKEFEGADLDNVPLENLELRVSAGDEIRIKIADWLSYGWYVWVPLVCAACLGLAYAIDRLKGP